MEFEADNFVLLYGIVLNIFMEAIKKKRMNDVNTRNRHLYIYYLMFMGSLGEDRKWMPRRVICERIGGVFHLKHAVVSKIINRMTKEKYDPSIPEIHEFVDIVDELYNISSKSELLESLK